MFLLVSRFLGMGLTMVAMAVTARYLGKDLFGVLSFATAVSLVLKAVADLGFGRIVCREVSRSRDGAEIYVTTAVILQIGTCVILFLVSWAFAAFFQARELLVPLLIVLATNLTLSVGQTYLFTTRAFERMDYELYVTTMYKLSTLVLALLVVFFRGGFGGILWSGLLASVLFVILAAGLLYKTFLAPAWGFDRAAARHMIMESIPLTIAGVLMTFMIRAGVFLLQYMATPSDVALFDVSNRTIFQLQILATAICVAVFPALSRGALGGQLQKDSEVYYRHTFKYLLFTGVGMAVVMFVGSRELVRLMFGREFDAAASTFQILAPSVVFIFLASLQDSLLVARGKQVWTMVSVIVSVIINLTLSVILIPKYSYVGASIGTLAAYAVMALMGAGFVRRCGVRVHATGLIIKITLAGALACVAGLFIHLDGTVVNLLARVFASFVAFVAAALAMGIISRHDLRFIRDARATARQARRNGRGTGKTLEDGGGIDVGP
jgi:O-antigen/teichoic acid export membrane protein